MERHNASKTDTPRHRHTERDTQRQTHRDTDTQTHRDTDRHTETQRHRDTQRHRQTQTDTHRHTDTPTHTETHLTAPTLPPPPANSGMHAGASSRAATIPCSAAPVCRQVALWAKNGLGGIYVHASAHDPIYYRARTNAQKAKAQSLPRLWGANASSLDRAKRCKALNLCRGTTCRHIALRVFCPHKSAELVARRRAQDSKRQCVTVEPPDPSKLADATRDATPIPGHAT